MSSLEDNKNFHVEIITPEKTRFRGDVEYLRLPGWEGEMGILMNHAPMVALIRPGECLTGYGGKEYYMTIGEGFVDIRDNNVLLVVSFAYKLEEIELKEVKK